MGFNKDKRKKLGELLAKRRAVTAGVGTSTPRSPPNSATSAPNTTKPAPVDGQKGVVAVVVNSEDEATCTGLVFKRPRVGEAATPSHSASGGLIPAFRDNPPSVSSPHDLVVHEGGEETAPEDYPMPPTPELSVLLQQALKRFQDKEI